MPPINMIMIYYCDKKLKKRLNVLEDDIITNKKNIDLLSSSKDTFLQDVFKMTVIVHVSAINHYHRNGSHLFWYTQ